MQKILRINSISKSFRLLMFVFLMLLFFMYVIYGMAVYYADIKEKNSLFPVNASRIDYVISDSIHNIEKYAEFIAKRISKHGDSKGINYINEMLGGDEVKNQPNISSVFDWVNDKDQLLASSQKGILLEPIDLSFRRYLKETRKDPWQLKFQSPSKGVPSGKFVIPGGIGVLDKSGKYIGTVTLGVQVKKLINKIFSLLNSNDTNFVIFTKDMEYVGGIHNKNLLSSEDIDLFKKIYSKQKEGYIEEGVYYENVVYKYISKTSQYDFVVFLGYGSNYFLKIFNDAILPRFLQFTFFGGAVIIMILFFKSRIANPLIEISKTIDAISNGESVKKFPRSSIYEINSVSKQLIDVVRYNNRERRYKRKLAEAEQKLKREMEISSQSRKAKNVFLATIKQKFSSYIKDIINISEEIMEEECDENILKKVEKIYGNACYMGTRITSELNRKLINTSEVLRQCMSFYQENALVNKIQYHYKVSDDLPEILIDEVHFRQIIVSSLKNVFLLTPENESITVYAYIENKDKEDQSLKIEISDTGFGGTEQFRNKFIEKTSEAKIMGYNDGDDLSISDIKILLELNGGDLEICNNNIDDTRINNLLITIPYNYDPEKNIFDDSGNIVNFPNKKNS